MLLQEVSNVILSLLVQLLEEHLKVFLVFSLYLELLLFEHLVKCCQFILFAIVFHVFV